MWEEKNVLGFKFSAKNFVKATKTRRPWGSLRGQNRQLGGGLVTISVQLWVLFVTSLAGIVLKVEQGQESREDFNSGENTDRLENHVVRKHSIAQQSDNHIHLILWKKKEVRKCLGRHSFTQACG